jgi:hypothetical protein
MTFWQLIGLVTSAFILGYMTGVWYATRLARREMDQQHRDHMAAMDEMARISLETIDEIGRDMRERHK